MATAAQVNQTTCVLNAVKTRGSTFTLLCVPILRQKNSFKYLEYGDVMVPNTLENTMLENMAWFVFVNKVILKAINNFWNGPHVSEMFEACDKLISGGWKAGKMLFRYLFLHPV